MKTLGDLWKSFLEGIDYTEIDPESLLQLAILARLKGVISEDTYGRLYSLANMDIYFIPVFDYVVEVIRVLTEDVYIRHYIDNTKLFENELFKKIRKIFNSISIPDYYKNNKHVFISSVNDHDDLWFWEREDKLFFLLKNETLDDLDSNLNRKYEFKYIKINDIPDEWEPGTCEKERTVKTLGIDALVRGYRDSFCLQEKDIDLSNDKKVSIKYYIVYRLYNPVVTVSTYENCMDVDCMGQSIYDKNLFIYKNEYLLLCEEGVVRFISKFDYFYAYYLVDENYIFAARGEEVPLERLNNKKYKDKRIYLYPTSSENKATISSSDLQKVLADKFKRAYLKPYLFRKIFQSDYTDSISIPYELVYNRLRRMLPTYPLSVNRLIQIADTLYREGAIDSKLKFYMKALGKLLSIFGYGNDFYDISYVLYNLALVSKHLKKSEEDNSPSLFSISLLRMLLKLKRFYNNPIEMILGAPSKVAEYDEFVDKNEERVFMCCVDLAQTGTKGSLSEETVIGRFSFSPNGIVISPAKKISDCSIDPYDHRIEYSDFSSDGFITYDLRIDRFVIFSYSRLGKEEKKQICNLYEIEYRNCISEKIE